MRNESTKHEKSHQGGDTPRFIFPYGLLCLIIFFSIYCVLSRYLLPSYTTTSCTGGETSTTTMPNQEVTNMSSPDCENANLRVKDWFMDYSLDFLIFGETALLTLHLLWWKRSRIIFLAFTCLGLGFLLKGINYKFAADGGMEDGLQSQEFYVVTAFYYLIWTVSALFFRIVMKNALGMLRTRVPENRSALGVKACVVLFFISPVLLLIGSIMGAALNQDNNKEIQILFLVGRIVWHIFHIILAMLAAIIWGNVSMEQPVKVWGLSNAHAGDGMFFSLVLTTLSWAIELSSTSNVGVVFGKVAYSGIVMSIYFAHNLMLSFHCPKLISAGKDVFRDSNLSRNIDISFSNEGTNAGRSEGSHWSRHDSVFTDTESASSDSEECTDASSFTGATSNEYDDTQGGVLAIPRKEHNVFSFLSMFFSTDHLAKSARDSQAEAFSGQGGEDSSFDLEDRLSKLGCCGCGDRDSSFNGPRPKDDDYSMSCSYDDSVGSTVATNIPLYIATSDGIELQASLVSQATSLAGEVETELCYGTDNVDSGRVHDWGKDDLIEKSQITNRTSRLRSSFQFFSMPHRLNNTTVYPMAKPSPIENSSCHGKIEGTSAGKILNDAHLTVGDVSNDSISKRVSTSKSRNPMRKVSKWKGNLRRTLSRHKFILPQKVDFKLKMLSPKCSPKPVNATYQVAASNEGDVEVDRDSLINGYRNDESSPSIAEQSKNRFRKTSDSFNGSDMDEQSTHLVTEDAENTVPSHRVPDYEPLQRQSEKIVKKVSPHGEETNRASLRQLYFLHLPESYTQDDVSMGRLEQGPSLQISIEDCSVLSGETTSSRSTAQSTSKYAIINDADMQRSKKKGEQTELMKKELPENFTRDNVSVGQLERGPSLHTLNEDCSVLSGETTLTSSTVQSTSQYVIINDADMQQSKKEGKQMELIKKELYLLHKSDREVVDKPNQLETASSLSLSTGNVVSLDPIDGTELKATQQETNLSDSRHLGELNSLREGRITSSSKQSSVSLVSEQKPHAERIVLHQEVSIDQMPSSGINQSSSLEPSGADFANESSKDSSTRDKFGHYLNEIETLLKNEGSTKLIHPGRSPNEEWSTSRDMSGSSESDTNTACPCPKYPNTSTSSTILRHKEQGTYRPKAESVGQPSPMSMSKMAKPKAKLFIPKPPSSTSRSRTRSATTTVSSKFRLSRHSLETIIESVGGDVESNDPAVMRGQSTQSTLFLLDDEGEI